MDDALVRELRGDHTLETEKYRSITDKYIRDRVISKLNQIDAVLIVYTDDAKAQEMVLCLCLCFISTSCCVWCRCRSIINMLL